MPTLRATRKQSGFTLVELLIVAIILAILAAIIIPQFASTTVDAQEAALRSNTSAMRSAIDLYRQQHGAYPAATAASGGTCSGTAGTGAAGTQQAMEDQLTRYSNTLGQTCSVPDAGFSFGPYVQDDDLPTNPISGTNAISIINTGDLEMTADGAGLGWKYDSTAGKFMVNDTNNDSQGVPFTTY